MILSSNAINDSRRAVSGVTYLLLARLKWTTAFYVLIINHNLHWVFWISVMDDSTILADEPNIIVSSIETSTSGLRNHDVRGDSLLRSPSRFIRCVIAWNGLIECINIRVVVIDYCLVVVQDHYLRCLSAGCNHGKLLSYLLHLPTSPASNSCGR
jgi:hypothetical protein